MTGKHQEHTWNDTKEEQRERKMSRGPQGLMQGYRGG